MINFRTQFVQLKIRLLLCEKVLLYSHLLFLIILWKPVFLMDWAKKFSRLSSRSIFLQNCFWIIILIGNNGFFACYYYNKFLLDEITWLCSWNSFCDSNCHDFFSLKGAIETCNEIFGKIGYSSSLHRPDWVILNYGNRYPTASNIVFRLIFLSISVSLSFWLILLF